MMAYVSSFVLSVFLMLAITGCRDDSPILTSTEQPIDSCGNEAPISPGDSIRSDWPSLHIAYTVKYMSVSKEYGYWTGVVFVDYWEEVTRFGVFVYDPHTESVLGFYDYTRYSQWSPDGKYLLISYEGSGYYVIDAASMMIQYSVAIDGAICPYWSKDGRYVYLHKTGGTWRVNPDGSGLTHIADSVVVGREIDSTHFVGFDARGLYIYNVDDGSKRNIYMAGINDNRFWFSTRLDWDISPDHSKILVELYDMGGFVPGRNTAGVFVIDLSTFEAKKVLEQQYWGDAYYPRWNTNSSFFASVFCRKGYMGRSMKMVWEYDLEKHTIRQITYPWMKIY
jgi:hypothetical protein